MPKERPLILHVDDLQWAEPTLLDLLDHIVELSRGAPILVLCAGRLELLEDRPTWGGGKLNAMSLLLEPLFTSECQVLLASLGDSLDHDTRGRVVAASEGNPLSLEEMAALAAATGTTAVPATIHALLAARLESLGNKEREVLEHGAIEGEVFHRLAVRALLGECTETEVDSRLATLVRKELIRPHPATIRGDDAFRFRHLLTRDAAYDTRIELGSAPETRDLSRGGFGLEQEAADALWGVTRRVWRWDRSARPGGSGVFRPRDRPPGHAMAQRENLCRLGTEVASARGITYGFGISIGLAGPGLCLAQPQGCR